MIDGYRLPSRTVKVRRVTADDWRQLAEVRLAALVDAPYAFGSSHAAESRFDEAEWRSRATGMVWFIALDSATAVGLVGGASLDRPTGRFLFAMWTQEQSRGTGADGNERARRFYQRLGFARTRNRKQLPSNPAVGADELRLAPATFHRLLLDEPGQNA